MKTAIKKLIVRFVPLPLRKFLARWINTRHWISAGNRAYWATELLTDLAERDVNEYHKFLWANHLAYAETYEVELRFGYENFNETRKQLFAEWPAIIRSTDIGSCQNVGSVLEIGCSLGYLLRYMETDLFPDATRLDGIDIDAYAIARGRQYLAAADSRVELFQGDMESMDSVLGDRQYDVVLGSGVLLYLDAASASRLVAQMLRRTRRLLTITALADPDTDNAHLEQSVTRARDGTWVHNVDKMIVDAGGRIVARRWEGGRIVDGNTIYFLHAVPPPDVA